MIECKDIWKYYQIGDVVTEAVRDISLKVAIGEFLAILGHSGSGKSTLLSMIGGLTRPSRGQVAVNGEDIWQWNDNERATFRNRTIGFVFQFASLIPTLTVLDNIALPSLFGGGMTKATRLRARDLAGLVGLSDKIDAYPSEISGGQQRRVAISRAFLNEPKIVLADEPTGDLDEATEAEVMDLFAGMCREHKTTILMVTHNRDLVKSADRTLVMKDGGIL
jgi:putative ABC transport system ATP-binding protein/lipoprotein-releasing system ATP-binding protein